MHSIIQQDIIMDGCQNEDSGNLLVVVAIKPVCVLWKTVQIGVQCMTINKWEHSSWGHFCIRGLPCIVHNLADAFHIIHHLITEPLALREKRGERGGGRETRTEINGSKWILNPWEVIFIWSFHFRILMKQNDQMYYQPRLILFI